MYKNIVSSLFLRQKSLIGEMPSCAGQRKKNCERETAEHRKIESRKMKRKERGKQSHLSFPLFTECHLEMEWKKLPNRRILRGAHQQRKAGKQRGKNGSKYVAKNADFSCFPLV